MSAIFLIDFDNVRPDSQEPYSRRSVSNAADNIKTRLLGFASKTLKIKDEVILRFYGGWFLKSRTRTYDADELLKWIHRRRGRDSNTGLRMNAELALALKDVPSSELYGTLRLSSQSKCLPLCHEHCNRSAQKMVDMMISFDLVFYSLQESAHIILVTSDEDMIPSAILASSRRGTALSMNWLRPKRPYGDSPNDRYLSNMSVNSFDGE